MNKKKMYLVKREVIATTVEKALKAKGHVYEVTLADEKSWPQEKTKKLGFNARGNNKIQ